MDIEYFGANCVVLSNKQVRLVFDDNLAVLGAKSITKDGDVAIFSNAHGLPAAETKLVIDLPGEYEAAGVSIQGIPARAHMEETAVKNATIYKVLVDDIRVLITGHVYPELNESQLEAIGTIDILVVPIGGNGYTLDPTGALQLIKKIEPKAVIVTHYADKGINYEVPQQSLEDALKVLSLEPSQTTKKLKLKEGMFTVEGATELIILEKN